MSQYDAVRQTLLVLLPELLLLAVATVMMTAGAFVRRPRCDWCAVATIASGVALILLLLIRSQATDPYSTVALNDPLSWYGRLVFLLSGLALFGLAHDQVDDARAAEFFGALLMIVAGSMVVASANELVFLFIGLELVSIPTYLLLYLSRRTETTQEAATKYFFLSIFSSALLVFGLAYLYGLAGVSNLRALSYLVNVAPVLQVNMLPLGLIAVVFIMAGLGFRVAAVPFHFYAPDVYQGSPTVIAAMLAWVPKGIGFVALIRVLTAVLGGSDALAGKAVIVAWIVAAVSMTLGNAVALLQDDLKRLLAYSSIAHAGYLMIGVAVALRNEPGTSATYLGSEAILFYLTAYALMNLGAFGVLLALGTPQRPVEKVDDLAGVGWSRPWFGFAMALCLFSLAGVPPLAGFWGKFEVFYSAFALGSDEDTRLFRILAVIGVLNAAAGAYYYLRIVMVMYLRPEGARASASGAAAGTFSLSRWPTAAVVAACAGLSLIFGIFPYPIARASRRAAVAAIAHPDPGTAPGTVARAEAHRSIRAR
jgi:NADH-quinone oxidoreductase subunit N